VLLGGIVSKLGTYGYCGSAWAISRGLGSCGSWLSVVGGDGSLCSLVAIAQTDIKKMVAYSSVAHLSYVLLASAAFTPS